MNGIKIRFEIDGSKDYHDNGTILAIVCTHKHYEYIDAEAIEDVRIAIMEMCRCNRYKGWRVSNFKIKSMEVA